MTSTTPAEAVRSVLEALREYLYRHYPERRNDRPLPLEFWTIDDDDLFMEALEYLPLHMGVTDSGHVPHLDKMPEGFRLAFPIFWLEDDYAFNGWTALTNAGTWLLPSAIAAYERIGMPSEAQALRAALRACEQDPDDTEAAEAAYQSVANPFADEDSRNEALFAFFRTNTHLFEPASPATDPS
jgi:hypothetical protein